MSPALEASREEGAILPAPVKELGAKAAADFARAKESSAAAFIVGGGVFFLLAFVLLWRWEQL